MRSAFVRTAPPKVGAREVGAHQYCILEVGLPQVRRAELGTSEVGALEVGQPQVRRAEFGTSQVCLLKVRCDATILLPPLVPLLNISK